jgi:thiamine-monophosphate kinase
MSAGEFDLIARIRARAGTRADIVLGIGDDAALLAPPPGLQLVVTADTLNAGVHFPEDSAAADIGWKALAVNLSDLAAMGAEPAWCTLSLSLPRSDAAWIDGFLDGFLDLAGRHGIALVGGDTTRGPLSISVTAMGLVEPGRALRRDGARPRTGSCAACAAGSSHATRGSGSRAAGYRHCLRRYFRRAAGGSRPYLIAERRGRAGRHRRVAGVGCVDGDVR